MFSEQIALPVIAAQPAWLNQCLLRLAVLTRVNISGDLTGTPTTVADTTRDADPKREIATATVSSKKLIPLC